MTKTIRPAKDPCPSRQAVPAYLSWLSGHFCAHTDATECLYYDYTIEAPDGVAFTLPRLAVRDMQDDLLLGIPRTALMQTGLKIIADPDPQGLIPYVVRPRAVGSITGSDPVDGLSMPEALTQMLRQHRNTPFLPVVKSTELIASLQGAGEIFLYELDPAELSRLSAFTRAELSRAISLKLSQARQVRPDGIQPAEQEYVTGPAHESQRKITETSLREVFRAEAEQGLETIKSLTIAWIQQPDRGIPAELLREMQVLTDGAHWLSLSELASFAAGMKTFWQHLSHAQASQTEKQAGLMIRSLHALETLLTHSLADLENPDRSPAALGNRADASHQQLMQTFDSFCQTSIQSQSRSPSRQLNELGQLITQARAITPDSQLLNRLSRSLADLRAFAQQSKAFAIAELAGAAETLLEEGRSGSRQCLRDALESVEQCLPPLQGMLREWQISGTVKPRVYLTRLLRRRARQIAEASFAQL